jgi:hypothetical protein
MITTPDLIESLVADAAPVKRLAPLARAAGWLAFAALILALVAVSHTLRPDLALLALQPRFLCGVGGALATGVLAAVAAFAVSVPGRSRAWLLLPLPGVLLWALAIGEGCVDWVGLPAGGSLPGEEAGCIALLVLVGAPLALAMLIMLRHAARIAPAAVGTLGGLAVAGLTATALSFFHAHEASAQVLAWNLGLALLLVALGRAFGRRMLAWVAPA